MLHNIQLYKKYKTVFLAVLLIAAGVSFSATPPKELRAKNKSEAKRGIETRLEQALECANNNQPPNDGFADQTKLFLKGCRPFLKELQKSDICEYYTLTAWVNHFKGDVDNAYLAAQKAHSTNPSNLDAKASYAAMALLAEKEPIFKRIRKKSNSHSKNILEFNEAALNTDLLQRSIPPLQAKCLNSTSFSYEPGQNALAVLFWKTNTPMPSPSLDTVTDPNDLSDPNSMPKQKRSGKNKRPRHGMNPEFGMHDSHDNMPGQNAPELSESFKAFGDLYNANVTNDKIKFIAVNTNQTEQLSAVINTLSTTAGMWASTMAKLPQSNIKEIADIETNSATLVIADKTGKIIYAGQSNGFLPKTMLQKVGGNTASANIDIAPPAPKEAAKKPRPVKPKKMSADDNGPGDTPKQPQLRTLPMEEQVQAEKRITYARDLFVSAGKKRFLRPKRGIDMCREIMKDYPNTKYYVEAQRILREEVPERFRKQYNLTDEELGITDQTKE